MCTEQLLEQVLKLSPDDRYRVAEIIMQSLNGPTSDVDRAWAEESVRRARACDEGRMRTFSLEEVFGED